MERSGLTWQETNKEHRWLIDEVVRQYVGLREMADLWSRSNGPSGASVGWAYWELMKSWEVGGNREHYEGAWR
jgi:hypothetical protein